MAPCKYRLELSQSSQNWCARLTPLPDPAPDPANPAPNPALTWAEFDSPLALLEWLEKDLPLDAEFLGLR